MTAMESSGGEYANTITWDWGDYGLYGAEHN
jgi:hypothetical protein